MDTTEHQDNDGSEQNKAMQSKLGALTSSLGTSQSQVQHLQQQLSMVL